MDFPRCNKTECNHNSNGRCEILTSSYGNKPCPFNAKQFETLEDATRAYNKALVVNGNLSTANERLIEERKELKATVKELKRKLSELAQELQKQDAELAEAKK